MRRQRLTQGHSQDSEVWRRLDRRLDGVAGFRGGYCPLQMPLKLVRSVRGTVAGHRPSALEGGGTPPPPSNASLGGGLAQGLGI